MTSKTKTTAPRAIPKTILLVDDDPSVREVIGRVLAEEGYRVLSASNGPGAIAIAASNSLDMVLLDLNMPGQGGWDTFEKLTSNNPLLPVIIITARPDALFTSVAAGVSALLEKPLDYPKLLAMLRVVLAESPEVRLARMMGRRSAFHYLPAGGKATRS